MLSDIAKELTARIQAMRAQDDQRYDLLNTYIDQLGHLSRSYSDACDDANRERLARSKLEAEVEAIQNRAQLLQRSVADASFVLVLIDADAYIFQDRYYAGATGGEKAAFDLQSSVRSYLEKAEPMLSNLPIIVKAFANADGMSRFLLNTGLVQSADSLAEFAKGFSQAFATSDFVLVGHGKDRADKKIKGIFEQFIRNPTCRHVVFGACHDNGYVRMLEDFASDSTFVQRLTLLHSPVVGREFKKLPFRSTKMDEVFRTTLLEVPPKLVGTVINKRARMDSEGRLPSPKRPCHSSRGSPVPEVTTVFQRSRSRDDPTVWVNALGQRVDSVLPQSPAGGWPQNAICKLKFCRAYHMNGKCRGNCGYSHAALSDEDKLTLRRSLREQVCHVGLSCRDVDCYYGHSCSCTKTKCSFSREMHKVDGSTAEVWNPRVKMAH